MGDDWMLEHCLPNFGYAAKRHRVTALSLFSLHPLFVLRISIARIFAGAFRAPITCLAGRLMHPFECIGDQVSELCKRHIMRWSACNHDVVEMVLSSRFCNHLQCRLKSATDSVAPDGIAKPLGDREAKSWLAL